MSCSTEVMVLPTWASACIARQVEAYVARRGSVGDAGLTRVAALLRAWPVYGDLGGVLLVAVDGQVYGRDNDTMEVRPERDPRWRTLAWAAAAEEVPELRTLLPPLPPGTPACEACGGAGHIQVPPACRCWCGTCWGLGW